MESKTEKTLLEEFEQINTDVNQKLNELYNSEENIKKRKTLQEYADIKEKMYQVKKDIDSLISENEYDAAIEKEKELANIEAKLKVYDKVQKELIQKPDFNDADIDLINDQLENLYKGKREIVYKKISSCIDELVNEYEELCWFRENMISLSSKCEYKKSSPDIMKNNMRFDIHNAESIYAVKKSNLYEHSKGILF